MSIPPWCFGGGQMMSEEQIRRKVIDVLAGEFELDEENLTAEATLYDDLGLDSLDAVDMVVALEKAFGMKMNNEEEVRAVRTVGDLIALIVRLGSRQQN